MICGREKSQRVQSTRRLKSMISLLGTSLDDWEGILGMGTSDPL